MTNLSYNRQRAGQVLKNCPYFLVTQLEQSLRKEASMKNLIVEIHDENLLPKTKLYFFAPWSIYYAYWLVLEQLRKNRGDFGKKAFFRTTL